MTPLSAHTMAHTILVGSGNLISQSCGDSLPAVCLFRQDGTTYRLTEHLWISDGLKTEVLVKADC